MAWHAWVSVAACATWAAAALVIRRHTAGLRRLADLRPPEPPAWPPLSVLVPACNEAATLEPAVASLLAQDYPGLEIVLVDDRSTDGTGAVVDALAARDARIVPVHVTSLPDGWLGKVHALAEARRRAGGAWLLFTDADIHFAPGVLRRAMAAAEAAGLDHLAVMPAIAPAGFWYDAAIAAFTAMGCLLVDMARAGTPGSGKFMGVGAFNLVRAAALDASAGLEWLKLEVIDDIGLGMVLHGAGAHGQVMNGAGVIAVRWYDGLGAMTRGGEKNSFSGVRYSYAGVAGVVALQLWLTAGLLAAPWAIPAPWGTAAEVSALGLFALFAGGAVRRMGGQGWLAVFAPLAGLLQAWIVARAAFLCWRRGGIAWRGTLYRLDELKRGQRLRL